MSTRETWAVQCSSCPATAPPSNISHKAAKIRANAAGWSNPSFNVWTCGYCVRSAQEQRTAKSTALGENNPQRSG